ncbi:MAG: UbiA prenyltransferase family protein, partial [Deltaproteobacteria bacterium]|nr:UbiA prenyltransferase family protein [Deltaproteobacteria bacterium]
MSRLAMFASRSPIVALLRPSQWIKNALVLAPLLFGGRLLETAPLLRTLAAFAAFCLAASAGYLMNDLRDVESDRAHPAKRLRPLAAGTVMPGRARTLACGLAAGALGIALVLGAGVFATVAGYLCVTALYSAFLRRLVILDVMTIGLLFVLRVEGGALAAQVAASDWLLVSTALLAVFLGLCKRRHELLLLGDTASAHRETLRGYSPQFLDPAISLLTSTALITYLLYAMAPETVARVGSTRMLLGGPFVLYGLLRYLQLTY